MTSLTQMRYGSRSLRHGRSRACRSNQARSLRLAAGERETSVKSRLQESRHETGDTGHEMVLARPVSPVSCPANQVRGRRMYLDSSSAAALALSSWVFFSSFLGWPGLSPPRAGISITVVASALSCSTVGEVE